LIVASVIPWGTRFPNRAVNLLTGPLGVAYCFYAALRLRGGYRRTWALFAASTLITSVGDALWLAPGSSLVELAEVLYLAALVPAALGILSYPLLEAAGMWRVLLVDVAVLTCGVLLLCYLLVLR